MKNETKIAIGIGALALVGYFYYRKSIEQKKTQEQHFEESQVGISQGEPISDKASLFNLFTRTRYTNPTGIPQSASRTLTNTQIARLNTVKIPKFAQTPVSSSYVGSRAGSEQQISNTNFQQ